VLLDKEVTAKEPSGPWEEYYAGRLAEHFT
jgi:hypothetical protein